MDAPKRAVRDYSSSPSMEFVASILRSSSSMKSLSDSLVINALFLMVPRIITSETHKSTDDQGDDLFGLLCVYALLIRYWVLLSDSFRSKCLPIYMDTVVPVVIAFVLLLVINLQYYILAPFPVSSVCFIVYICNKIGVKESSLQQHGSGSQDKDTKESGVLVGASTDQPSRSTDGSGKNSKRIELQKTVVVPYSMLVFSALNGDGNPLMSHFLLFSCCVLWALELMYSRLLIDSKDRALEPALECIQMAYMVMLFITAHTLAAEWLGEVTALVCMPEVMAGLVWFSTLLHSDTSSRAAVKKATSESDNKDRTIFKGFDLDGPKFVITLGAVLASLIAICAYAFVEEGELLASWITRATVACGTAGCMPYLSVWMISRWPGSSIPSSDEVTRLLRFLANVCLTGASLLLFALLADKTILVDLLFGFDYFNLLNYLPAFYFTTAAALFVKLIVAP